MANLSENLKSGINTVYNFSPALSNLYTLKLYPVISSSDSLDSISMVPFFEYHSPKVDFNGESLTMKRNEVTKRFQLTENAYKRTETVSITLRESEKWEVKRYHEKWLAEFYNKENDYYISAISETAAKKRFRILRIFLPKCEYCVKMLILPNNTGNLNLGWGASGSIITHNITYNVENWKWEKIEQ